MKTNFFALSRSALESWILNNFPTANAVSRAKDTFREVYKTGVVHPQSSVVLAKELVTGLSSDFEFEPPLAVVDAFQSSMDGSVKFIMKLKSDDLQIESVLIPERGRLTQCLSTQVGCAQACRFCQTGRMGLLRNLTTAEIVGQVIVAQRWLNSQDGQRSGIQGMPANIVFMGMGEPLDNLDNVIESVRVFTDNQALNISHNKITVSTVGLLPALDRLLTETKVSVALSLHSPFGEERSRIMPVNTRFPLESVVDVLRRHAGVTRESFMIQYTLIRGVNDSQVHAEKLVDLLAGLPAKINLIPLNEHEGAAFRRPDLTSVYNFQAFLKSHGFVATVRLSKGRDVGAACGQLIQKTAQG